MCIINCVLECELDSHCSSDWVLWMGRFAREWILSGRTLHVCKHTNMDINSHKDLSPAGDPLSCRVQPESSSSGSLRKTQAGVLKQAGNKLCRTVGPHEQGWRPLPYSKQSQHREVMLKNVICQLKLQSVTFGALAVNKQNCVRLAEGHCSRISFSLLCLWQITQVPATLQWFLQEPV